MATRSRSTGRSTTRGGGSRRSAGAGAGAGAGPPAAAEAATAAAAQDGERASARAPAAAEPGRKPTKRKEKQATAVDSARHRVEPGARFQLADVDPGEGGELKKKAIAKELAAHRERIAVLQARLWAEQRQGLLIVLQAMDTGGKDGTIKHVFQGVNPQGCQVWSFKQPSAEELAHDFLWRYHAKVPTRGMITIFNRSHYEDVLVVRVKELVPEGIWSARYEAINQFELALSQAGVTVLKFFLHISRDEQKRRLERRLANPDKNWKFSKADLAERARWDDYQRAYQDAITRCSTRHAPWYVVPSDSRRYRNLVVARAIADTLDAMGPQFPPAEPGLERVRVRA
jgi:PPK2 family polyphosphate:nucleotide phosphotransferase